jgi:O-antigen/teichoic acid export membrane protein
MNKHLAIIAVGRLSQMIIMFLTYRVLSTVLSVPDMGVYYFLLSISSAFGLIYANPIGMYANRMLHSWQDHGVMLRNLKFIIKVFLIGSILTAPFLFLFQDKISIDQHSLIFVVGILIFYVFSTSINGTLIPSLNLLGFTNQFVIWTLVTNVLGLILSVVLVKYVSPHPLNWLIGQGISFFLCGLVGFFILLRRNQDKENVYTDSITVRLTRVSKFGIPIVITNLAVWVLGQSFRFFYKENIDLTILGELTFGLGLATSLCVALEYLFQQLYLPTFYRQINDQVSDNSVVWNNLLNKLIPPYIFITFYIIGLSPFILRILADVKFKNSGMYLALGAIVELFRMLGNIFNTATHSEMRTHKAIAPYLCGGLITLVGVLIISSHPQFVEYTPMCLMAGHLTALILLAVNVKGMIKIHVDKKIIFNCILTSLIFLTALFFKKLGDSLMYSILLNAVYGLVLLWFLYKSYSDKRAGV